MRRRTETLLCVVAAAGLTACASAPTRQFGEAQGTISAAEKVGANELPKAAYHLELARHQIAAARPLMDGGRSDKRNAERLLVRAETDALLALQMARTEQMRQEARNAWSTVNQLQAESTGESMTDESNMEESTETMIEEDQSSDQGRDEHEHHE